MKIVITKGTGTGPTELAAFDKALFAAGIANHNLIPLSSVIPPGSELIEEPYTNAQGNTFGHRLYVVLSEERVQTSGTEAWAGLGWVQNTTTKAGLLVEHHGSSEAEVKELIMKSLTAMTAYRDEKYGEIQMALAGVPCETEPVSALVAAVFQVKGWD